MWRRWQEGENCADIARALGTYSGPLHRLLRQRGCVAELRYRSARLLSLSEREEIPRGICAGDSFRAMARRMGRAPSTISREIARHGGKGSYRALAADRKAWHKAQRPKPRRLAQQSALALLVAQKPRVNWSPQQIAAWLAREFGNDESRRVSHETIYRTLFIQTRGALKKELLAHLGSRAGDGRSQALQHRQPHPGVLLQSQSPWQRGSNENNNGLLRQYFPKCSDVSRYSQAHLNKVALQLNQRPHQTLGFDTPANILHALVASTG